jgi:hypothetical protein
MSEISKTMNAAIECNNIAVELLHRGRLSEALDTFRDAAQVLYPVSLAFQSGTPEGSAKPSTLPKASSVDEDIKAVEQAKAKLSLRVTASLAEKYLTTENWFVCTESLTLERSSDEPTSCTIESAIIAYNTGLTYHLYGSASSVLEALRLFEMVFGLARSISGDDRSSKISMASLNNAGQIQHSLGNYNSSRRYLNTLRSYILSLPSTSDKETLTERRSLLLNAMILQEPSNALAA